MSEKRALAETISQEHDVKVPPQVWKFFTAAQKGDWIATSNLFYSLEAGIHPRSGQGWLPPPLWGTIHDTFGAYELVAAWNPQFLTQFGDGIVKSIPPGSIYFGGTDGGRFAVSAFSQLHSEGRPFFTLTQNALADGNYLGYLRDMYGAKIYIAGTNDSQNCFQEYLQDAQARLKHDRDFPNEPRQIQPGEDVRMVGGKVQVSGQVAVMAINALLVKIIFDKNPGHEFYYEESFPLTWMYPHLTPHQFIFKLNREPLKEISEETVRADRAFWTRATDSWLGAWLTTNTSLREIGDFVDSTYLKNDLKEFKGDRQFVQDLQARKAFSKLRSAIGGVYAWRANQAKNSTERQFMKAEADFAFRQAFAVCPVSPEAVFRYVSMLVAEGRASEAVRLADEARKLEPDNLQLEQVVEQILRLKQQGNQSPANQ